MWEFINAFGAGIAFVVGVLFAVTIYSFMARKTDDKYRKHAELVEHRLEGYVENTALMADALQRIASAKEDAN